MVGFEAAFGCRGLGEQNLKDAPGNPHHALIFTNPDAAFAALLSIACSGAKFGLTGPQKNFGMHVNSRLLLFDLSVILATIVNEGEPS
jgi:hypothetical protein